MMMFQNFSILSPMRPRIPKDKQRDAKVKQELPDYTHIAYHSPKKITRAAAAAIQPSIYVGNGNRYVQRPNLPMPRGQVGLYERPQAWPSSSSVTPIAVEHDGNTSTTECTIITGGASIHQHKRLAQNHCWETDIIPMLVQPFMKLQSETGNLQREPRPVETQCVCTTGGQPLSLVVLRFNSTRSVIILMTIH